MLLAVLSGIIAAIQGQFLGTLDRTMGMQASLFITYLTGMVIVGTLTLGTGGVQWRQLQMLPWYVPTTGILGIAIIGSIGYVVPRLGLATSLTLIVASQLMMAALIDHFGWLGASVRLLDMPRFIGFVLLLAGVRLIIH